MKKNKKIKPDLNCYNELLKTCSLIQDFITAEKIFIVMNKEK